MAASPHLGLLLAACFLLGTVGGDMASDRAECSTQLVGLATCLPYVEGDAKVPTPDCCAGLKQVLAKNPKCLCVLIKDRDDPQLGLKLNVTLALSLPSVCSAPANISECPRLLNLAPNSKDAQIFKQFGSGSSAQGNATTSSSGNSTVGGRGGSEVTHASGAERSNDYRRGVERVVGILVLVLPLVILVC